MSSTSSPSGSKAPRPSADEAARALRDIHRHQDEAHTSADSSRWVYVLFGVLFFVFFASPDFLGPAATGWASAAFGALSLGYVALLNTRKGGALLGQPVRPRRHEISGRFLRYALLAVLVAALALQLFPPHWHLSVPYWRTAVGAVAGVGLALFGPRCRQVLLSATLRSGGHSGKTAVDDRS
ncbi:hypothetical protein [Streptomyces sp. NPDC054765]